MAINKVKNTSINLTISRDMKSKLEDIAKEENRSTTNLINTILKQYIYDKERY